VPVLVIVIILAVVVLLITASGLYVGTRRRRGVEAPTPEAARTGTAAAPVAEKVAAPEAELEALEAEAPEAEAPEAELAPAGIAPEAELVEGVAPPELQERLGKTRGVIGSYLASLRRRKGVDDTTWDELEEALILADVGLPTVTPLLKGLKAKAKAGELKDGDEVVEALKVALRALLTKGDRSLHHESSGDGHPDVWLFVGVNGVGKTTTIGKVAAKEADAGHTVVVAAGDTFRAAAGDQLEVWAERSGARIVQGAPGADPSSVIFDAVQSAAARGADLVLGDTAGRLHTKFNLMEELRKVKRIAERPPATLSEVLLVLDATTGQNGLVQAREFAKAVDVTGVVLTKLDGSAKGGIVLAIASELGLPIKLIGLGEKLEDLVSFDPDEFVEALLAPS
jgi:fused signal recognition particle receptor